MLIKFRYGRNMLGLVKNSVCIFVKVCLCKIIPLWENIFDSHLLTFIWLPWWLSGKESAHQCRRHGFSP